MAANPLAPPPHTFSMQREVSDGVALLKCKGYLMGDSSEQLSMELKNLFPHCSQVRLDLSELRSMDSSGLGGLVSSYLAAKSVGCNIVLVNPSRRIKALLNTTHLISVFSTQGE